MGRDENGLDCWGLVRLFYANEMGVELPAYSAVGHGTNENNELAKEINARMQNWRPVESPSPGDCILLNVYGRPIHIGIVERRGRMIHVCKNNNVTSEKYTSMKWAKRIEGFYTYVAC